MALTADAFILRDRKFLLLRRKGGAGDGFWYLPGGFVEQEEDPADAIVRETREEAGLEIHDPDLLRVWSYRLSSGQDAFHATFYAESPSGGVRLSSEHSGYRWAAPSEYRGYLDAAVDPQDPVHASFHPQLLRNLKLLEERLG